MSRIDSWHRKSSTGRHFQNGHHNTAQIQHFPILTTFHMWVDYDVPKWFLTSKNLYWSPFSKWAPQYRTNSTLFDFNVLIDSRHWKISTGFHFQNGRHNTATIQHCSISKVDFNLFFKPVVCDWFGRLHNRYIIMISCFIYFILLFGTILIMRVYKYYYIFRIIFRSRS
jgi:hypothetical protein